MSRTAWLGERRGEIVSFGSTLPRDRPSISLRDDDGGRAVAAPPQCPVCADCGEREGQRRDVAEARAEAVAAGKAEGLAETAALRALLERATAAVRRAQGSRDDAMTELIVDVALGLCAELAPAASAMDRRALVQLVHRAIAGSGGAGNHLVLRMCADDVAGLSGQLPAGVTCEVGADLTHGELFCEAPRQVVDGRWPARLAALREPLLALVRASEPAFELATESPGVEVGGGDGA